jgi:hypothetical protein
LTFFLHSIQASSETGGPQVVANEKVPRIYFDVVFELVTPEQPQSRAQGAAPAGMSAADPHPEK